METQELLERFETVVLDFRARSPLTTPLGKETDSLSWAIRLGIQTVPTQVMFDVQGREIFRNEGYVKAFHVQSILDYVSSGAYLKVEDFQRYIQKRADRLREKGVTVNLME